MSLRHLAGMRCVRWAYDHQQDAQVSVPWRGCVVSPLAPSAILPARSLRPLAGMRCVCLLVNEARSICESPSPGGDALCRQFLIKKRKKKFDFLWE